MKKSFFKDYYLYRLRGLRGFFIASCVLSFLSGPLMLTGLFIMVENTDQDGGFGAFYTLVLGLYILIVTVPALILLGMIIPMVSRRHLNRKAYVDTMGTLPITYKQRYWGDLLAEVTAYVAPVVVGGLYTLAVTFVYANVEDLPLFGNMKDTQSFLSSAALTLVFSCIGGFALSNLIVQCSGKVGSGIMCSVLSAFLLPTIVISLGMIGAASAIGVDETRAASDACSAIPPIGWLVKIFINGELDDFFNARSVRFAVNSPILLSVLLAIIAAFIVGGYFIGKKRRSELVGESLVFETASCAVSIGIAAAVMSIFMVNLTSRSKASDYIIMLVVTFVIFMAFELLHRRKKIKVLGSLIRYVCVCAAGLGFFALMRSTNGLGAEDYLPKPGSVKEVSISFGLDRSTSDEYIFDDNNAVKVVIDQHRDILKSKDDLYTGVELVISYKLKNGLEVARGYNIHDDSIITNFSEQLLNLPQKGNNPLNLLRDESIELNARISKNVTVETSTDPSNTPDYSNTGSYIIKPEKMSELRKLLLNDIENNFSDFLIDDDNSDESEYGLLHVFYYENGQQNYELYHIDKAYTQTIAFLEDPDNLVVSVEASYDPENTYSIQYSFDGGSFNARFSASSNNPLPPELAALFTTEKPGEEYSERFEIRCYEDLGSRFFIRKADEKRAAELFLNAMKNYRFDEDVHFYGNTNMEDQLL